MSDSWWFGQWMRSEPASLLVALLTSLSCCGSLLLSQNHFSHPYCALSMTRYSLTHTIYEWVHGLARNQESFFLDNRCGMFAGPQLEKTVTLHWQWPPVMARLLCGRPRSTTLPSPEGQKWPGRRWLHQQPPTQRAFPPLCSSADVQKILKRDVDKMF